MISAQPKHNDEIRQLKITENEEEDIEGPSQIKILGFLTNTRARHDSQAKKVISETSNVINEAYKVKNYMNERSKKILMESRVLSKMKYNAPVLVGESEETKLKLYRIVHRAARFILNDYCYRQNICNIMKKVGWKMPKDMLEEASAKFAHRIIYTKEPEGLYDYIEPPEQEATQNTHTNQEAEPEDPSLVHSSKESSISTACQIS